MSRAPQARHALALFAMAFLMTVSFAGILSPAPNASATTFSNIGIQVDHPSYAGMSEAVPIVITAYGGPAADLGGNYSLTEILISATNSTGFDWSPKPTMNELGVFAVNITMPGAAGQTATFTVNITSQSSDTMNQTYSTSQFKIKVVEPIVISAKVFNTGDVEAKNVTALFYADGTLIHTAEFNVSAGGSKTLSYNWTFASIKRGQHAVTITIDDANDIVEFSNGNNVVTRTIYVGEQGNPAGAVLTVLLIIVAAIFVLTYLQKPAKRAKKF
jgi:hypothetical protein